MDPRKMSHKLYTYLNIRWRYFITELDADCINEDTTYLPKLRLEFQQKGVSSVGKEVH